MAFGSMLPMIKGCHERRVQARFPVFLNDLCVRGEGMAPFWTILDSRAARKLREIAKGILVCESSLFTDIHRI